PASAIPYAGLADPGRKCHRHWLAKSARLLTRLGSFCGAVCDGNAGRTDALHRARTGVAAAPPHAGSSVTAPLHPADTPLPPVSPATAGKGVRGPASETLPGRR